jgi:SAM-dependent methyltransferase
MQPDLIVDHASGFPSTTPTPDDKGASTDAYQARQEENHPAVVERFLRPIIEPLAPSTILDVGCGVGGMVNALVDRGYDAFGVDLLDNVEAWQRLGRSRERFCVVSPDHLVLPFADGSIDFIFSLGVIEHVGTTNGHSDRRPDYHDVREQWLREVYRVLKPGGHMLIGGPNRHFPIDTHGPDSRASALELWLSRKARVSIHKTWGEHFLWAFEDFDRYLHGFRYTVTGVSMKNYYNYSKHIGGLAARMFRLYVNHLPGGLMKSAFNPWTIGLIEKHEA